MARIFPRGVLARVREMRIGASLTSGLRNALSTLRSGFYQSPTNPALRDTKIDLDTARALYYNTDPNLNKGAFVARNIIDGTSDYIGLPVLTVADDAVDGVINEWVHKYWKSALREMYRNTLRDADSWVRIRLPLPNVLLGPGEQDIPEIQVYDSDRVTPYYNPATQELERVEILTRVYMEDEPFDPHSLYATGARSHGREHEIIEIISKQTYTYWDATNQRLMDDFTTTNDWGFVPMIQVFNDYDSALHGGSSDLEGVYPFFKILHDFVMQTKTSHGYHADPKVQVQVKDVQNFIRNNFPDSMVNGQFTGKVSWKDRDVFFMESDSQTGNEAISFITATLNTGESVSLMELIIDFMCMASGVTEGVLFRAKAEGATTSDEFQRFKEKIARKRDNFAPFIQQLIVMGMYITTKNPVKPLLSWRSIDTQDAIDESTAFSNNVTALEVLHRSTVISRSTYRASVRPFLPAMKDDATEEKTAQADVAKETQAQLDLQTKMNALNPPSTTPPGPNGTTKNGRTALPLEVTAPSPGN